MADLTTWLRGGDCFHFLKCYCMAGSGRRWFDARETAGKLVGAMVGSAVVGGKPIRGVCKMWRRNVALAEVKKDAA